MAWIVLLLLLINNNDADPIHINGSCLNAAAHLLFTESIHICNLLIFLALCTVKWGLGSAHIVRRPASDG